MSLAVPITTAQMTGGTTAYVPAPEQMAAGGHGNVSNPMLGTPGISATVSSGSNSVSFAAAGWIAVGVLGLLYLNHAGFKFAHVPL